MIGNLISTAYQTFPRLASLSQSYSSIFTPSTIANSWNLILSRTRMRYHFPKPNERRRIKRQGWEARMSTPNGRKVIMRRILKGKHFLTH